MILTLNDTLSFDYYLLDKPYFIITLALLNTHKTILIITCSKVLNQQFPEQAVDGQVNDTDSEKQRRDLEEDEEEEEGQEDEEEDTNDDDVDVDEEAVVGGGAGAIVAPGRELRNR